jgi:hypothetical protein
VLIDQAITGFTLPATLTFGDPAFTVSGTGGASGNPVTFSASGACAILDPANANVVSITGTGLCEVIASQAGNAAYAPAPLVTETVTVEKAAATVAFDAGTLHQTYDGLVKTVSTTTSPVGLQVDISFTGTPQGAGSYPVTATINELNYTAGEATGTLTIDKATQSIVFGALADRTFGDAAFTVTATGGDSGNTVTFAALGNCSVLGNLVTLTAPGSCTVTASQAGNANYTAATDVPRSFTIAAPPVNNPIVNPGDQVNREGDEVELAIQVLGVRSSNRGKGGDNRGTFAALNLPGGLDIDKNGVIRGHVKKNTARQYDVTVMFTQDGQTYAQRFTWTILPAKSR